ncbi:MAG TPA: SagB family peptide dehydrogenase [Candidatus Dormibacteraeota bacterium]|jgi:SagB-type dehydrogenase family enzyme
MTSRCPDRAARRALESLVLAFRDGAPPIDAPTPGLRAAVAALASDGATEDELGRMVREADGQREAAPFHLRLRRWRRLGWISHALTAEGRPLAVVVPMAAGLVLPADPVATDARFRLSRFAWCRRDGDALVLESPLSIARTVLPGGQGAAVVGELARPRSASDLGSGVCGLEEAAARALLTLLACAGAVAPAREDGTLAEDADPALVQWEFHDLLFHSRSRRGGHDQPSGATFRFMGQIEPAPAVRPPPPGPALPLPRPDPARLAADDPPFTAVLEGRRSIREHGRHPIGARQLGELLHRAARVRRLTAADPASGLPYPVTSRPYPSAGGAYDLELYVTVRACADLAAGLFHYDPLDHALRRVAWPGQHVDALLREAQASAGLPEPPQVLVTMASRIQRLSWKYSGLAYALALKNAGALMQTMCLVATAMGLAACPLGAGSSDRFAAAAGTGVAEPPVGELILGSAP